MRARQPGDYAGKGSKADVRARLRAVARGGRQVVVKISPGKNRTMRAVRKHLQYIGEDGEGKVIDQDGREYQGRDEVDGLAWTWQHVGSELPEESDVRLAFNIVFSMPEGTDERAVYAAVKATAEAEFVGHQWVMGQHFDQPQVHCHLAVKAEGMDGVRLNPRKEELQRWRERFAHELRERGVEAEATRRATRQHQQRINKPWAVTRLEERGRTPTTAPAQGDQARIEKWKTTEQKAANSLDKIVDALRRSTDTVDQMLAKEILASQVGELTRKNLNPDTRTRPERERT